MADQAPIAETWPAADQTLTPVAETWSVADQTSIAGTWPVADQTPIAEVAPVADHFPIVAAPTAAEGPVDQVPPAVVEPSYEEPSTVVEARAGLPAGEEPTSPWPEDTRQVVDEIPADVTADVMNVLNAGAEQAVSEPTPQEWTPSAAEIPMEVTPELRQQEPVAEIADRAAASPETSQHERLEPVPHAEAPAQAEDETRQAVVVPLARTHIKPESASVPFTPSEDAALMHTLRVAAARGASTVYVVAQSKPMIRIDGEIGPLESEPTSPRPTSIVW